jgi:hypothetical protein
VFHFACETVVGEVEETEGMVLEAPWDGSGELVVRQSEILELRSERKSTEGSSESIARETDTGEVQEGP